MYHGRWKRVEIQEENNGLLHLYCAKYVGGEDTTMTFERTGNIVEQLFISNHRLYVQSVKRDSLIAMNQKEEQEKHFAFVKHRITWNYLQVFPLAIIMWNYSQGRTRAISLVCPCGVNML